MFKRFDTNGDGYFNEIEFGCAFTVMGVTGFSNDSLRKLIRVADKDKNGRIDYKEFEQFLMAESVEKEATEVLETVKETKFELEDDQ